MRTLFAVSFLTIAVFNQAVMAAPPPEPGKPSAVPTFEDTGVQERNEVKDLSLRTLDNKPYRLSMAWRDRPALIVLSSISCPVSRDNCAAVDRLARKYAGKLDVLVIYTVEAHPVGAPSPYSDREWLTERNVRDRILVKQPTTLIKRIEQANAYQQHMQIQATMVVDSMDNAAWKHIGPAPNSAILVNRKGRVVMRQVWLAPPAIETMIRWVLLRHANEKLIAKGEPYRDGSKTLTWRFRRSLRPGNTQWRDKVLTTSPSLVNLMIGMGRADDVGDTLLHRYAAWDRIDDIRLILKYNPAIDQINSKGLTPLHLAADQSAAVIRLLLDHDANPNAFDRQGLTPVHRALLAGRTDNARSMLKAGGAMDLSVAAGLGDLDAMRRYIKLYRQTDIYLKVRGGRALSFAAANDRAEAIELLLGSGVDRSTKVDGHTAMHYAITLHKHTAAKVLLESGFSAETQIDRYIGDALHYAAMSDDAEMIRLLLKHGADIESLNIDETTPLHLAAESGSVEATRVLVDAGASVYARTGREAPRPCGPLVMDDRPHLDTPLHLAARQGHDKVVGILLKADAPLRYKNRDKLTPLRAAQEKQKSDASESRLRVIEMLRGAATKQRVKGQ